MKRVPVRLGDRSYEVLTGGGLDRAESAPAALAPFVEKRHVVVVADADVAELHAGRLHALLAALGAARVTLLTFPAGEASKNLQTLEALYHQAVAAKVDRRAVVAAFGGGVTGDLAGFFAASFLRGLPFVQFPTTLLALVDSSVGGKVGVDLPEGKNLVGAFHQPKLVWGELEFLRTLPDREWRCGLGEIVKYGVILDAALFAKLESHTLESLQADTAELAAVVGRCCELKAEVVTQDEHETGLRAILNYGHTFGHAVEVLGGYSKYNHGEGVAIGMGMAADLAVALGLCGADVPARQDALLKRLGLPVCCAGAEFAPEAVLEKMGSDKKVLDGNLRLILPRRVGTVEIVTVPVADRPALLRVIAGRVQ
jgi:3-dehydroquinate synthase